MSRVKEWLWDYGPLFIVFGGLAGVILLLVGLCMTGDYYYSRYECNKDADKMGLQHDYGYWTGCMVRAESLDPWVPLDKVRVVAGELFTEDDANE